MNNIIDQTLLNNSNDIKKILVNSKFISWICKIVQIIIFKFCSTNKSVESNIQSVFYLLQAFMYL